MIEPKSETTCCGFVVYLPEFQIWAIGPEAGDPDESPGSVVWWNYCPKCGTRIGRDGTMSKMVPAEATT